jgi:hypothetical protein
LLCLPWNSLNNQKGDVLCVRFRSALSRRSHALLSGRDQRSRKKLSQA